MLNYNLLNKINVNDEWYTQEYAIKPILEFIKPNSNILCPFDKMDSKFVRVLEKSGHKVRNIHIDDGIDFFNYIKSDVDKYEYIISNPPFNETVFKPIREKIDQCELLVFDKRIKFISNNEIIFKNLPSETAYICHDILPKQIIYIELK